MGILDDAIRQHLDLKRRQGTADDELKRLEDEAFGPPQRPGDPDFPEAAEEGALPLEDAEPADLAAEPPPPAAEVEAPAGEPPAEEPPAEEPPAAEPEAEADVEREAAAAEEAPGFFDQTEDLDLDLDLEIEEEIEDVGEIELEKTAPPPAEEAPIETLPTVEHHFEDAIDEAEVVDDEDDDEAAHAMDADTEGNRGDAGEAEAADSSEEEGDEEDVLEETPEFLRDAPEDDELWFEQGEPKDFDF